MHSGSVKVDLRRGHERGVVRHSCYYLFYPFGAPGNGRRLGLYGSDMPRRLALSADNRYEHQVLLSTWNPPDRSPLATVTSRALGKVLRILAGIK